MIVHPYPHVILRENKMIFGAHADRLQQGMRRSFGAAIGTAAKVEVDQPLMTVKVKAGQEALARESLKRGSAKLPIACRIVISKIEASPVKTENAQPETETA
jgi:large subunit ribosomal protein L10e